MNVNFKIVLIGLVILSFMGCGNKPKTIAPTKTGQTSTQGQNGGTGIFSEHNNQMSAQGIDGEVHKVFVNEVLPTDHYQFLHVNEGDDQYWIATRIKDIQAGKTYFYKGGLLKTDYVNKEYNRTFSRMYLVSNIVPAAHGDETAENHAIIGDNAVDNNNSPKPVNSPGIQRQFGDIEEPGSVRITELVNNPGKYEGKTIQVSGECVKFNPNIMDRNWVHLKDGSKDDFDLVVTTREMAAEGQIFTFRGTVSLHKDFGAGYHYALIIENGKIINP
jgi:hypothetical protein